MNAIEDRTDQLGEIHAEVFPPEPKPEPRQHRPANGFAPDDQRVIDKVIADSRWASVWSGGGSYPSDSERDLALCGRIGFFCEWDRSRIDRIFRQSPLYRPKWDERRGEKTYGAMTIDKAVSGKSDCYNWNGNGKHNGHTKQPKGDSTDPGPAPDFDRATELANAEELHRQHGSELRYHDDRGEYYVYTRTHWQRDTGGQVVRWAKEIARTSSARLSESVSQRDLDKFQKIVESARGISGVLKLLQTEPGVTTTSEHFDQNDYLLNVANGTIDLHTGKLRQHDPNDLITHCLSTPYDPTAAAPLWESVVYRSMGGNADLIGYLKRWGGLFLTGSPNTHELLIAHGTGANGKSVIFDALCGLLESYAGVAPESLLIARHGQSEHPTEIADLLGKRLVVASETESGATLRLQLIKRLTGDATIKARFMRQDFFEFRRTHKLVLITNNRPRLSENTEAVWRRLRLLPFNVVIPESERDTNLLDKLKSERAGILAWCVRGCLEHQREGMNPPDEVMIATKEYRDEADELAEFISARCIVGDAGVFRVSRADLHAAYVTWSKQTNERNPLDRNALYEAIRRREGIHDDQFKVAGAPVRGFKGIGLAAPSSEGSR